MKDDCSETIIGAKITSTPDTSEKKASLIIVYGIGAGKMFLLDRSKMVLGRAINCDIHITDPSVSRFHAKFTVDGAGDVMIEDMNSSNGTLVNGVRIGVPVCLNDGDKIRVGSAVILKFSYQDEMDEEFQQGLFTSAIRDCLTESYNRRFMMELLASEFSEAVRYNVPLSVIMIDVDHFKQVNDTHGHLGGDAVLRSIAKTMPTVLRNADMLGRYGGEEFLVVLPHTDLPSATQAAERIRKCVQESPIEFNGKTIPITISAGVATLYNKSYKDIHELITMADACLYTAKTAGRNCVDCGATDSSDTVSQTDPDAVK